MSGPRSDLLIVVAPIGRDGELICKQLRAAGLRAEQMTDITQASARVTEGIGGLIVTEEALANEAMDVLIRAVAAQQAWSELPVIILTGLIGSDRKPHTYDALRRVTNVTLVDRPVRVASLVSAAESALSARERQYEARELMAQLEERVHERDRFLAVLGHELRNPLGAILLASQMTDPDGRLAAEHALLIERQSRHLTRLVNDLLDLSRVAAGKIVLKRQICDLREIAAQSLRVVAPAAERQHVSIRVDTGEEPILVDADPIRVDQILANVLTNAVKYTPESGHVTVTLSTDDHDAVVTVKDDGVGIAPERIDGIFELFAQAENAIGRAQGGMGIGLALVRNLVQLHGGSVAAKSDGVGTGSEFVVRLPLAKDIPVAAETKRTEEAVHASPRRIVIVEDNHDVRHLLGLKLRRLGHTVADAADGHDGLRVVLEERPDLALVDLGLPGIDGYEVARGVREKLGRDVVLVAVSGFGQPEDKRRALEAGFDEHITKPADVHEIENLLQRYPPRNSADA